MVYADLTRPHLWPTATLLEARLECQERLRVFRTGPDARAVSTKLLAQIDQVLDQRQVPLKSRTLR